MDPNQHDPSDGSPEQERIGHTLENRYRIHEVLAQGGMGVVYRGERLGLNRPVAIKFLHANFAANPQARERFERELQAMSRLTHPNCISVIDYGFADSPFIVMEYVTGSTLKDVIADEGRVQPMRALFIVSQILGALAHAHSQDMVHRDVKPANVVLANVEGVMDHVYVLDFGLAKFLSSAAQDQNELTASWMVLGTPAYMSPEQARAEPIGAATDIYATGVVLFELLTGSKPYYAENPIDTIQLHQSAPVPSIRERLPEADFSDELDQVVQTALAKDASQRFASAAAFAEALDEVPEATPTMTGIRVRAQTPRPRADSVMPAGATSIMASGRMGAAARRPSTMSLSNVDMQEISSGPSTPGQPERVATPTPVPERRTSPSDAVAEEPAASASDAAAPEQAPAASRPSVPTRSGSRAARFVLGSMFLAVAMVVAWYATRDEVLQSAGLALPLPAAQRERPGDDGTPGRAAAAGTQTAAASPEAAGADAQDERAATPVDAANESDETGETGEAGELQASDEPDVGDDTETASPAPPDEESKQPRPRTPDAGDEIDEIERLVKQGRRDEALRRIAQMRRTDFTRSGYLAYVQGNLYFEKKQWGNGLKAYEDALRLKPDYRSQATLNQNAIRAFSNKQTWPKARALFTGKIRHAGLRYLRQAAQSDKNRLVRDRAKQVISTINRK